MEKKKRFCEECFKRDHSFVAAAMHIDGQDLCLPCIRAEQLNPEDGEAIPADEIAVVDPRLARALEKSRQAPAVKVQKESAPIQAQGEEVMPRKNPGVEPKKCKCGKVLRAKQVWLGACKECREAAQANSAKPAPKKPGRKPNVVSDGGAPAVQPETAPPVATPRVTIGVTEAALDRCWSRLDLAGKAVAIQAVLEV